VCVYTVQSMYVAYTSSNASSPKYTASGGCGYVYDSFPNNTEFLRPYAHHKSWDTAVFIVGKAWY
jgi:hypothetical protein